MDWIVHLFTNLDFLNFVILLAIFGGFTALGRGIQWFVKAISGHLLHRQRLGLETEKERGRNLDKQLELEKLRQQPKAMHPLTVDDVAALHSSAYDGGYQGMSQQQEQ
jgi:hypothetical protein